MDESHNAFFRAFPAARPVFEGRMPTEYEMAIEWDRRRTDLIHAAVFAEKWAYSHRQEHTDTEGKQRCNHPTRIARYGSAVLGCRPSSAQDDRFAITIGANFKLRAGDGELIQYHPVDRWKLCSEPEAIIRAKAFPLYCRRTYGLALYSNNIQKEDVSGVFCNIQHPCADCRKYLLAHLTNDSPVILIRDLLPCEPIPVSRMKRSADEPITSYLDGLLVEDWTFGQILRHHNYVVGRRCGNTETS